MTEEAWNRWGAEDEKGALNRIGPSQVRAAAALVRSGQVLSLAQSLSPRTAVPPHRNGVMHFMDRDGGDYASGARQPGGFQFAEDTLLLPLHVGTHIDALCHVWHDDKLYNGFPGHGIRSTNGAARCGIDKMPPIFTRGLLLDIVRLRGAAVLDGETISLAELQEAASQAGVTPGEGDAVVIRTGWLERQQSGEAISFNTEPGIGLQAALWLAKSGVALVGADNYAVEVLPFPSGQVFPVHQCLIRNYGIPLMEGLDLRALSETGAGAFAFAAAPLPIVGGTASPIVPMAVL